MKKSAGKFGVWALSALLVFGTLDAEAARRVGGGGNTGRQSSNVTQREAAPSTAPSQAQRSQAAAPPAAAAQAPRSRWGGMLGGLAAGLGLAWLASSLGLGAGLANIMTMLLIGLVGVMVIAYVMRARRAKEEGAALAAPGMSGLSNREGAENVWNNPASNTPAPVARSGSMIGSGLGLASGTAGAPSTWSVPDGFDQAGFLGAAKASFVNLQLAWDQSNTATLRSMTTDEMFGVMRSAMIARDEEGAGSGVMKVEGLSAQLLGIESDGAGYLASVEFEGTRVEGNALPETFREVWNMSKVGSAGWLLAGIQTMR